MALKRARTRAASATDGHTSGCESPSPYVTTQVSMSHSVDSSLAFFIRPLRCFLYVAYRVASLTIHCRVTFLRAMAGTREGACSSAVQTKGKWLGWWCELVGRTVGFY